MSRPALGPELLDQLPGDAEHKRRVRVAMETIFAGKPVIDAIAELGISKPRFHEIRHEILAGAIAAAAPKPGGRPPQRTATEADLEQLRQQAQRREQDLKIISEGLRLRSELELVLGRRLGRRRDPPPTLATAMAARGHQMDAAPAADTAAKGGLRTQPLRLAPTLARLSAPPAT